MDEVADEVVAALAGPVAAAMPLIVGRVPSTPAAELGRLRSIADGDTWPTSRIGRETRSRGWSRRGSAVGEAFGSMPSAMTARLIGALELTVSELEFAAVPDLSGLLGEPRTGTFGWISVGEEDEATTGIGTLEQVWPGAGALVVALARRLVGDPRVASQLSVGPDVTEEADIAARHGAAHLALAAATAAAVLPRAGVEAWATKPPTVVGVAIGAAVLLLRETPMPPSYAAALLARVREEYLLPQQLHGLAPVSGHQLALLEGPDVPEVDFSGNGLVAVVPGGAVIRTGLESGHLQIILGILDGPPPAVTEGWEEIVEVSWHAAAGGASIVGPAAHGTSFRRVTPPWPGDYRLRVHARGRDIPTEPHAEHYQLLVWQAPAAPEVVYARTDRLGHRLRGEPEPAPVERPEEAYAWLRRSSLVVAATVTVVTGTDVAGVLEAFGADATQPESFQAFDRSPDPWVTVLDVGSAVLAVEFNGYQGANEPVLARASSRGRAASMYWNVNALTRLSFAEHGDVLLSVEPFDEIAAPPRVAENLVGLDFGDYLRSKPSMGLVAVQRFTGYGPTADDLARIEAAGVAFRIVPDLPTLYPYHPQPSHHLGPIVDALTGRPDAELRDLAWWAAAEAVRYAGLGDDPDIAASLEARALTGPAQVRARRSQLEGGEHRSLWLTLHRATNPDPLAAAIETLEAARFAAGPHAANLIADAMARLR